MKKYVLILLITAVVFISGCGGNTTSPPPTTPPPASQADAEFLIGMPVSPPKDFTSASQIFDRLRESGASLTEFRVGWNNLEKTPGSIDFTIDPFPLLPVLETYPDVKQGHILNIKPLETLIRTMPADLADKDFDDPAVISRFNNLIDKIAEQDFSRDLDYVLIGQEINVYLSQHTDELDAFETFYAGAVRRIREKMPHVKVGPVVTHSAAEGDIEIFNRLMEHSDIAAFTYYPLGKEDGTWIMEPVSTVAGNLTLLAEASGNKPFGFLEVGYSSHPVNRGSGALQAEFVKEMFTTLDPYRKSGDMEFLQYYMLFDFPPELSREFAATQGVTDSGFFEYLSNLGLRDYETGNPKAAWGVYVQGSNAWSNGADLPSGW